MDRSGRATIRDANMLRPDADQHIIPAALQQRLLRPQDRKGETAGKRLHYERAVSVRHPARQFVDRGLAKMTSDEDVARSLEDLARRAHLNQSAIAHDADAVAQ